MPRHHRKRTPMENNRARENGTADKGKALGLAGSHLAQIKYQHHQAGFGMESTEEAEAKEAKEHLATVNGGVDGRGGLTQGQESHSHDQWRGRWERQALLKAKEQLATVNGGVDKRGSLQLRPRNG